MFLISSGNIVQESLLEAKIMEIPTSSTASSAASTQVLLDKVDADYFVKDNTAELKFVIKRRVEIL